GRVALILDTVGLAQEANVGSGVARDADLVDEADDRSRRAREAVLVVDLGDGHRGALMLSTVARLEQLSSAAIEASSRGPVVQYRGELLPLVSLSALTGMGTGRPLVASEEVDDLDVVVWTGPEGQIGLVVDRILDIVDDDLQVSVGSDGSVVAVVDGHVTDVIDVAALLTATTGSTAVGLLTPARQS